MNRLNRIVRVPPGVYRALVAIGIVWVVVGWAFNVALWIACLAGGATYGALMARRLVTVKLAPFSRDRGIVIWVHYRNPEPAHQPRVVWDEPLAGHAAPSTRPTQTNS